MICTLGMRSMKIIILEFIHKTLISNKRKLKIKKKKIHCLIPKKNYNLLFIHGKIGKIIKHHIR